MKSILVVAFAVAFASVSEADFQVNTRTSNRQTNPAIAIAANGSFVIVWTSYLQDGNSNGIYGQLFDNTGSFVGPEFRINNTVLGNQKEPAVAMDARGNFVVVWQGPGINEEDIFARRFAADGQPLGEEFIVNTTKTRRQLSPNVAMNGTGKSVVVWENLDVPQLGYRAICAQIYDEGGQACGNELVVNFEASICRYPDVAVFETGAFIVVWVHESSSNSLLMRRFMADGTSIYSPRKVNVQNFTSLTMPSIAANNAGNYIIAWDGHSDTYVQDDAFIRCFHSSHIPITLPIVVDTYHNGAQTNPQVAMNSYGYFIVAWETDADSPQTAKDIFARRFYYPPNSHGEILPVKNQFQMNTYLPEDQRFPVVTLSDANNFVAAWQSCGQDGSDEGIFAKMRMKIPSADFNGDGFVNFRDFCYLAATWLFENSLVKTDLIDDDIVNNEDLNAFCWQWLTYCSTCQQVDINSDNTVDFADYTLLADNWLKTGPKLVGDITKNGRVDAEDLKALLAHWLKICAN